MVLPAMIPGSVSGRMMRKKMCRGVPPRSRAASMSLPVELLDGRVDGQDHEGQQCVDQPDEHGHLGVKHHDRLVDDSEIEQEGVDDAVGLEEYNQCIGAYERRGPEWDDHEQEQNPLDASGKRARIKAKG